MDDSTAVKRLKAMIAAFEAGKFTIPNNRAGKPINYDDIPDDITVYASLNPDDTKGKE